MNQYNTKTPQNITILGAGLVGSLLAVILSKRGNKVNLYERRPDARQTNIYAGKSINLAMSNRGWRALRKAGLEQDIAAIALPMYARGVHGVDGSFTRQPYSHKGEAIYSVSRGGLNCKLMDLANAQGVNIHFNQRCDDVDFEKKTVTFTQTETHAHSTVPYDVLFGSDGAFSALRLSMMLKTDRFNYQQEYIEHGYKELHISPGANGEFKLEKDCLHIWPRKSFMIIALPNIDGSFTCTLFLAHDGDISFATINTREAVDHFFKTYFADLIPFIPDYSDQYFNHATSPLNIIRCYPWVKDTAALIGDAAHAIVPFYGQGMNAGFEDCTILDELLEKENHWDKVLDTYQKMRKPNGDAVAELAMMNFVEMRDSVIDEKFLRKKELEKRLIAEHPEYQTLYEMVTFIETPYKEALERGKQNDSLLNTLYEQGRVEDRWHDSDIQALIHSYLA